MITAVLIMWLANILKAMLVRTVVLEEPKQESIISLDTPATILRDHPLEITVV